jgi:hypothetical protein
MQFWGKVSEKLRRIRTQGEDKSRLHQLELSEQEVLTPSDKCGIMGAGECPYRAVSSY